MTDKSIIEKCFTKGSETYNNEALIQKKIAAKLAHLLLNLGFEKFEQVLEIGCGTGFLTKQIINNFSFQEYYLNDLVNKTVNEIITPSPIAIKNLKFIKGDAETISFPENMDAIVSTSTFQWFNFLEEFISKMQKLLKKKGVFAFSTFGPNNYKEIKSTLNIGLSYKSKEEIERILNANFEIIHSEEWTEQKHFNSPTEVLKHMKLTGVNGVKTSYIGKERLTKFHNDYVRLFSNTLNQVSLTYNPIIIIAKQK